MLFSATTVGLSMAVMALFPMYFLKSSAYTIVVTAIIVAIAAVVVTPAAIVLLGPRLHVLDARRVLHRILHGQRSFRDHAHQPLEEQFWYRSTRYVLRHAMPIGLSVVALLLLLGAPFLGVKWGFPDERVLPESASARQVADMLDNDFANGFGTEVSVVVPDARGVTPPSCSGTPQTCRACPTCRPSAHRPGRSPRAIGWGRPSPPPVSPTAARS